MDISAVAHAADAGFCPGMPGWGVGFAPLERNAVKIWQLLLLTLALTVGQCSPVTRSNQTTVIVVVGAAGEEEYGTNFVRQATLWKSACERGGCREITVGLEENGKTNDFELLKETLEAEPTLEREDLWLVLIGHGTF